MYRSCIMERHKEALTVQGDASTDIKDGESTRVARVVTDSVHGRFRPFRVHCDACHIDIDGTYVAIETHFNELHTADRQCCYCKGKVFTYRRVIENDDLTDMSSEEFIYHKCRNYQEQ